MRRSVTFARAPAEMTFHAGKSVPATFEIMLWANLLLVGWDAPSRGTETNEVLDRERGREKEREREWKGKKMQEG